MKTTIFSQYNNYRLCLIAYNVMATQYPSIKRASDEKRLNSQLWNEVICFTYVGQLLDEIVKRDIQKDYFLSVLIVEKLPM